MPMTLCACNPDIHAVALPSHAAAGAFLARNLLYAGDAYCYCLGMSNTPSPRRLAENEVIFRQANEKVSRELDDLRQAAASDGHTGMVPDKDPELHFYCECSDEKCRKRIVMSPAKYKQLHQNSSQFVLLPGHNVPELERVVDGSKEYIVVEKVITPPAQGKRLNPTDLENA